MFTTKLEKYFKAIETVFSEFGEYKKLYEQRENNDKEILECMTYDRQKDAYYKDRKKALEDVKKVCNDNLEKITNEARAELQSIREKAKKEFRSYNAKDLDTATIELIKTGILTASELEELATDYYSNPTMLRVIGKALLDTCKDTSDPREITKRQKAITMMKKGGEALEAIHSVSEWVYFCLGGYKPLEKRTLNATDGAFTAVKFGEMYYKQCGSIILNAMYEEQRALNPTATGTELLENLNLNTYYKSVLNGIRKEEAERQERKEEAEKEALKPYRSALSGAIISNEKVVTTETLKTIGV